VLQNEELDKLDTNHWKLVTKFTGIGGGGYNQPYADSLMVDSTDSYIVVKNGAGGVDLIDLSAANASYKGTSGADPFAGGEGNDTYIVNNAGDTVTEKGDEGYDKVKASVDFTLSANVEVLDLSGSAVSGVGNAQDNVIVGDLQANLLDGGAGADLLSGGRGDDYLTGDVGVDTVLGGAGDDTLDGGDNTDTASYADAVRRVKVDLSIADAQNTKGGGVDLLISIENLIGSSHNDVLVGGEGPNQLDGGAGDDVLIGGANPDRLIGGEGSDTFKFTAKGDSHDNQVDTIVDLNAEDRIDLSVIDADTTVKGNQAFTLVSHFDGHAGQAILVQGERYATLLELDVNGDQHADMIVRLVGDQLDFNNFVL
jgi:Ca2+-binding RTX toxin-like protein